MPGSITSSSRAAEPTDAASISDLLGCAPGHARAWHYPRRTAARPDGDRTGSPITIEIAAFLRRPRPRSNWSVEFVFGEVLSRLGPGFRVRREVAPFASNGLFRRLAIAVNAAMRQGDVNHVTGDITFVALLLSRRRTVVTFLDCGVISGEPNLRKAVLRLLWFKLPARRCTAITVISSAVKEDLVRETGVAPEKVTVVPVFVSDKYVADPRPFRRERPVILHVGTKPNKNLPRLIRALDGLPCRLEIVGELGAEHRELLARHRINYGNHVSLDADAIVERYRDCDLLAFCSTFEGFGMPILEANRVGRPVVTGNVASMPEVAGDAACLVDPFDPASIRAGIERVLGDEAYREDLVRRGFDNAERYSADEITAAYERIYREVAASARSRA